MDSLRDEAEDYAKALEAAGVEVKLKRYKGHFHNSMYVLSACMLLILLQLSALCVQD